MNQIKSNGQREIERERERRIHTNKYIEKGKKQK